MQAFRARWYSGSADIIESYMTASICPGVIWLLAWERIDSKLEAGVAGQYDLQSEALEALEALRCSETMKH